MMQIENRKEEVPFAHYAALFPSLDPREAAARTGAEWDGKDLVLSSKYANPTEVDEELTGRIRSSFFILGPILSRFSVNLSSSKG